VAARPPLALPLSNNGSSSSSSNGTARPPAWPLSPLLSSPLSQSLPASAPASAPAPAPAPACSHPPPLEQHVLPFRARVPQVPARRRCSRRQGPAIMHMRVMPCLPSHSTALRAPAASLLFLLLGRLPHSQSQPLPSHPALRALRHPRSASRICLNSYPASSPCGCFRRAAARRGLACWSIAVRCHCSHRVLDAALADKEAAPWQSTTWTC